MMSKFKCNVCEYIYQPALGDKRGDVESGPPSKTSLKAGDAQLVVRRRINSTRMSPYVAHDV